jgi:hypothetical protein
MTEVDDYYKGKPGDWRGAEGQDRSYKHWKRWEWYMSGRLGESGEFVDISSQLRKAERQVEKMEDFSTRGINSFWSSEGPASTDAVGIGRADRIAFHPNNENIFYVGTPAGGLWKTTDKGASWTPLTDNLPSIGISGICVSPDNPNEIFVLTGDADSDYLDGFVSDFNYERTTEGVMRSQNGGVTWHPMGELSQFNYIAFKMVQQPTDPDVLLVATTTGIYRTENAGLTWTQTRAGVFYDVEFMPGTQYAVAAGKTEVVYSLSGGLAWGVSSLNVALNNPKRVEIAVTPHHPTAVYLLAGGVSADSTYHGTYKSTNSGLSFTQLNTAPNILGAQSNGGGSRNQSDYDLAMAVSPTNHNIVVTGAIQLWRSTNGGNDFSYAQTQTHSDIHDLAYNPIDGSLYACTDAGVYRSLDNGNTWEPLWTGFVTGQMFHMRGTPLNNNDFLAGFQDNGIKARVAGSYWEDIRGADGFDVSFFPTTADKFYATLDMQLWRMDGTFQNVTPDPDSNGNKQWFGTVTTHVSNPNIVYAGYSNVFRSDDQGATWEDLGGSGSWSLATCPSRQNRIYAAGDASYADSGDYTPEIYRSDSLGYNWVSLLDGATFASVRKITDIGVSPINSNHVYATIGGFNGSKKVFRSTSAGTVWVHWTSNLPNLPINSVAVAGDGNSVYIGTDLGVFYRHTSMTEWMPFRNGLPNVPVTDLYIQNNAGKIFAATFGRAMWSADLVSDCPGSLILSGTFTGYGLFQAENEIRTTQEIHYGIMSELHLTAGDVIVMRPGFVANRTSYFTASINACGSGGIPGD